MSDPNRFDGRVAVVTGAARGIGARIAATLAERGAVVARAYVRPLDEWVVEELPTPPRQGDHTRHRVDVRSAQSCRALVSEVVERHGRPGTPIVGIGRHQPRHRNHGGEAARL